MPNGLAMLMRGKSHRVWVTIELHAKWLGHADARQVFDLPDTTPHTSAVYDRATFSDRPLHVISDAFCDKLPAASQHGIPTYSDDNRRSIGLPFVSPVAPDVTGDACLRNEDQFLK